MVIEIFKRRKVGSNNYSYCANNFDWMAENPNKKHLVIEASAQNPPKLLDELEQKLLLLYPNRGQGIEFRFPSKEDRLIQISSTTETFESINDKDFETFWSYCKLVFKEWFK